jgi:hypothetical protein
MSERFTIEVHEVAPGSKRLFGPYLLGTDVEVETPKRGRDQIVRFYLPDLDRNDIDFDAAFLNLHSFEVKLTRPNGETLTTAGHVEAPDGSGYVTIVGGDFKVE